MARASPDEERQADEQSAEPFAALDREQPVEFGCSAGVAGGCSRPVTLVLARESSRKARMGKRAGARPRPISAAQHWPCELLPSWGCARRISVVAAYQESSRAIARNRSKMGRRMDYHRRIPRVARLGEERERLPQGEARGSQALTSRGTE